MPDHHDTPDDTDLAGNPFRQLNKKAFPDRKAKTKPAPTPQPKKQRAAAGSDAADEALFLEAMSNARPLAASPRDDDWPGQALLDARPVQTKKSGAAPRPNPEAATPSANAQPSEHARPQHNASPKGTSPNAAPPKDPAEGFDFTSAMRDVKPLSGKGREVLPEPEAKPAPPPANDPAQDFIEGKFEFALHHTTEYVEGHVIGLDLLTVGKLQAGQLSPEGHLDLHGLNALQAYQSLIGFMRNAYLRSWRAVLIVPGRGLNSPHGVPVLRERVQIWLTQEPLRRVVLAFCTAQPADGGAGALYVLLRKFRKGQGKVQWDRTPVDPDLLLQ